MIGLIQGLRERGALRGLSLLLPALLLAGCADEREEAAGVSYSSPRVLARGGPFRGVNGIMFGPDGLLYAASVATPAIGVVNPDTGEVVRTFGAAERAEGPDDLAFGPDGSLYWNNILQGDVVRRAPDGTTAVIASPGPGVNPITFSDDGRLFVAQCFLDVRLFEIDPAGRSEPRLITGELGPGCGLNGMDFGPDGKLYGPRWFNGEVVKVDVDTGSFETVASGFGVPSALKFDSRGRLHVLDALRGEVVRVDLATGDKEIVGRVTPSNADNLAFDSEDRLFVSGFGDGSIVEVRGDDTRVVVPPGEANSAGGLAVVDGPNGPVLYVADFFSLRGLDPRTGRAEYVARDIIGFSDVGSATSIAARGNGELILTTWLDSAVRLWDPAANKRVAEVAGLARPVHAVALGDELLISEADAHRVIRVDPNAPDVRTAVAADMSEPAGLAVADGDVFVADRVAGTILQIADGGAVLAAPRQVAEGLEGPEGIAAAAGSLYVIEAGAGRLTRIDLSSGTRAALLTNIETHETLFDGIALDADSRIYLTAKRAAEVWVLDPE